MNRSSSISGPLSTYSYWLCFRNRAKKSLKECSNWAANRCLTCHLCSRQPRIAGVGRGQSWGRIVEQRGAGRRSGRSSGLTRDSAPNHMRGRSSLTHTCLKDRPHPCLAKVFKRRQPHSLEHLSHGFRVVA